MGKIKEEGPPLPPSSSAPSKALLTPTLTPNRAAIIISDRPPRRPFPSLLPSRTLLRCIRYTTPSIERPTIQQYRLRRDAYTSTHSLTRSGFDTPASDDSEPAQDKDERGHDAHRASRTLVRTPRRPSVDTKREGAIPSCSREVASTSIQSWASAQSRGMPAADRPSRVSRILTLALPGLGLGLDPSVQAPMPRQMLSFCVCLPPVLPPGLSARCLLYQSACPRSFSEGQFPSKAELGSLSQCSSRQSLNGHAPEPLHPIEHHRAQTPHIQPAPVSGVPLKAFFS